jgi:hypothetical protein
VFLAASIRRAGVTLVRQLPQAIRVISIGSKPGALTKFGRGS